MRHSLLALAAVVSLASLPWAGVLAASSDTPSGASPVDEPRNVIDAEYAFAAAAKPLGVRGAFLKFLANDSIICAPLPVNGVASTAAGKATSDSLFWYPTQSQTAGSGDLGYTMGPWTLRTADGKTELHGTFLSVWRKQPDDAWRVVLDCGVSHPKFDRTPVGIKTPPPGGLTPVSSSAPAADAAAAGSWKDPVAAAEARFTAAASREPAAALKEFAAPDIHLMMDDVLPAVGPAAAQSSVSATKLGGTWQHVFASEARDGTLGYAWGYIGDVTAAKPAAVYVNIWRKAQPGAPWQIVAQSLQILPTKK